MLLLIDFREKWIFYFLNQQQVDTDKVYSTSINGIELFFKVTNLIVGDFLITNDKEEVYLAIERKTVKDLSSSIIDGRFREQKQRLIESFQDPNKILYLIEGHKKLATKGISKTMIDGSIQNLIFKHQFNVLHTENEQDTFENLIMLYKKICNGDFNYESPPQSIGSCITKKSKVIQNVFIHQLSVLPGVSTNLASKIKDRYHCMSNLIQSFIESDCKDMLKDIQVSEKRKLGKVLSEKIYNSLFT